MKPRVRQIGGEWYVTLGFAAMRFLEWRTAVQFALNYRIEPK